MPPTIGGTLNPLRVRVAHGQRLLHHDVDAARGGGLDDRGMIEGVGERRDRLRLGAVEHRGEIAEQRGLGDAVPLGVLLSQRRVGVEDADDLHVLARLGGAEESGHVPVHETGDREPQRRGRRLLLRLRGQQRGEHTRDPQRRKHQSLHRAILSGIDRLSCASQRQRLQRIADRISLHSVIETLPPAEGRQARQREKAPEHVNRPRRQRRHGRRRTCEKLMLLVSSVTAPFLASSSAAGCSRRWSA